MLNSGYENTSVIEFSVLGRQRLLRWLWQTHGSPHKNNSWWMSVSSAEPRVIVVSFGNKNNKLVFDLTWSDTYTVYATKQDFESAKFKLSPPNSGA